MNKVLKVIFFVIVLFLANLHLICQVRIKKRDSSAVIIRLKSEEDFYDLSILKNKKCQEVLLSFNSYPTYSEMNYVYSMIALCSTLRSISFSVHNSETLKEEGLIYIPEKFGFFSIEQLELSSFFAIDSVIDNWPLRVVRITSSENGSEQGFKRLLSPLAKKNTIRSLHLDGNFDSIYFYSNFENLVILNVSGKVNYLNPKYFQLPNIRSIQIDYRAVSSYIHDLDFSSLPPWKLGIDLLFDRIDYEYSFTIIDSLKAKNPHILWRADYY